MKKLVIVLIISFIGFIVYGQGSYLSEEGVLNRVFDSTNNRLYTSEGRAYDSNTTSINTNLVAGRSIGHGQVNSADKKGARQLSGDIDCIEIKIKPLLTNTGKLIYIGGSSVTEKTGYELLSNDNELPLTLRVDNTSDIYMSPDVGGDGVSFIYITK